MCENYYTKKVNTEKEGNISRPIAKDIPVITLDEKVDHKGRPSEVFESPSGKEANDVNFSKENLRTRTIDVAPIEMVNSLCTNANSAEESRPITQCPICSDIEKSSFDLEEHINRVHFESSFSNVSPVAESEIFSCFLCSKSFEVSSLLELHINSVHEDVLSPSKPSLPISTDDDTSSGVCPVCFRSEFFSGAELELHIEKHFSSKSSIDELGHCNQQSEHEQKNESFDKELQELSRLRTLYGMDNGGNFSQQSITNMEKSVYSGEMSVANYYERKIVLNVMEQKGLDDGRSCTTGLIDPIRSACESSNKVKSVWLCTAVNHYASTYGDRGWGCGYRNIQMILSCLQCRIGIYGYLFSGLTQMPSISQIQLQIENAWKLGFDVQGCEQLEGKLSDTRKWIGATEVATLFASSKIRFRLIDFHKPTGPNGTHSDLFRWCLDYFSKPSDFKPPIYLQHQGHSRTVIGVEELSDSDFPRLLIFDPGHSPSQMSQMTLKKAAFKAMHLIRKNINGMKSKQYQMVVIDGDQIESDQEYIESKVLRSVRIPKE